MTPRSPRAVTTALGAAMLVVATGLIGLIGLTGSSGAQQIEPSTTASSTETSAGVTTTSVGASKQQAKAGPGDIVLSQYKAGTISVISTGEQVSTLVEGLAAPTGVVALDSGAVLFAENTANRISALGGPYGDTLTPVVPDVTGPYALGLSPEQAIYVTQVNEGKVGQVDTVNGKIVPIGDGLSRPTAVAGYNREVYVAEAGTGKVVKFDAERQRVEVATDLGTPNGIAIAPDGTIYVSDFTGDRIIKIAPNGDKTDWAQVTGPRQLALDPAFGKSGQPFQVVAGTSDGIVQFDQDAKVIATVPFPDQAVAGVGVVPGGPPPSVTPTTPVPTPTTVRPTTTVPTSSALDEPQAASSSSAGGILLALLIAIVVIAGVGFGLYRYSKQRGKRTEEEAGFTDLRELSVTMTQAMGPCAAQEVELAEAEDTLHQVVGQRLGAEGRLADAEHRAESGRTREEAARAKEAELREARREANSVEDDAPPPPLSLAELGLTTEAGRAALQAFGRGELDAVKLRERWDELGESSAVAAVQGHSEKIARTTPWPEERQASLAAEQALQEYELADEDARDARADIERMREREAQLQERIEVARVAVDDCHKRQKLADEDAAAQAASALADIQISSDLAALSGKDKGKAPEPVAEASGRADGDDAREADGGDDGDGPAANGPPEPTDHTDRAATVAEPVDGDSTGKIPRPAAPPPPPPPPPTGARGVRSTSGIPTPPPTLQQLIEQSRSAHAAAPPRRRVDTNAVVDLDAEEAAGPERDGLFLTPSSADDDHADDDDDDDGESIDAGAGRGRRRRPWRR